MDVFYSFRWILGCALGGYFVLTIVLAVSRLAGALRGSGRTQDFARLCASYAVVSIRVRPVSGELVEIAIWLAVLAFLWGAHGWMN